MNTEQYQDALRNNSIGFAIKNEGMHLIVEGPVGYVDVWPTTSKWICRGGQKQGFGLRELLLYITKGETLQTTKAPVNITLSHTTALWLRSVMQNSIWCSPENEPEEDSKPRAEVFNALEKVKP